MNTPRTVLISGASRGIGKAIALKFASEKYNICINCKTNKDLLEELKKTILDGGCDCMSFVGDVSVPDVAKEMYESIYKHFNKVDIVVNNAGISYIGLLQDMSFEEWDQVIRTNLYSVFNCSKFAIDSMVRNKFGKIINISSVWGNVGASCEVAYSSSKGAVNSFTRALAKELAPSNIQVNAISCGMIDTDMNSSFDISEKEEIINSIPAMRIGEASEVADLVFYLASAPSYINGQIIGIDGAWI